ncbi:UNVERIFIED_ORG: DNA invertase Pin-like site-specific DNA recombinase [Rhizobium esperanzae]
MRRMTTISLTTQSPLRAVGYYRVSTGRQHERDLSIPDQQRQTINCCSANGWQLVDEYHEAGLTASDDNRPEFQRMIERATDGDHPFDVIIVHSYSRFFRDSLQSEMYIARLKRSKVKVFSITQPLGDDDPQSKMMRQMIGIFDEYTLREISKHVRRAMSENARQGFWNGQTPPLGYKLEVAETRGDKVKRRLAIDDVEAELVRLIFQLCDLGDGATGPLGTKKIVSYLNDRGYRTRRGGLFGTSSVQQMLTNTTYVGTFVWNRYNSETKEPNPPELTVPMPVPAIIEQELFDRVQSTLRMRDPRVTPPRFTTGAILLTGLAVCGKCQGAMTLRTGTARNGKVHTYYSCSNRNKKGSMSCEGLSMPMEKVDWLVTNRLIERLLTPERIGEIITEITKQRNAKSAQGKPPVKAAGQAA